jgi:hypothetical protein
VRVSSQSTLSVMTFPLDPNAPGRPRRSEFVRQSFANAAELAAGVAEPEPEISIRLATLEEHEPVVLAEVGGKPVAALGLRAGDARVADPARAGAGILALLPLHRLEALLVASIFGV